MRSRLSYHDVPAAHIAYPSYTRQMSSISAAGRTVTRQPSRAGSAPGVIQTDGGDVAQALLPPSLYVTGRIQAVRQELKPDLWKIAYQGVRRLVSQTEVVSGTIMVQCLHEGSEKYCYKRFTCCVFWAKIDSFVYLYPSVSCDIFHL